MKLIEISKIFFHENQFIYVVLTVEHDKNFKNKKIFATFGKIAISLIQIKKSVPLESAKAKLQNKTKKSYF